MLVAYAGSHLLLDEAQHRRNTLVVRVERLIEFDAPEHGLCSIVERLVQRSPEIAGDFLREPGTEKDGEAVGLGGGFENTSVGTAFIEHEIGVFAHRDAPPVYEVRFVTTRDALDREHLAEQPVFHAPRNA